MESSVTSKLTSEEVRDAFRYLFPDELPSLKQLAQSLPLNPLVINIGAGSGTSGLAFLESRPDLRLVTIDVQEENSPLGCLYAERDVVQRAGLWDTWGVRYWQRHADSKDVGAEWVAQDVDMVFVDGEHSYEGCAGDIEIWLPNIKPGGIIAVHDYAKSYILPNPNGPHPKPWPGVDEAVDELLVGTYPLILHVQSLIAFRVPSA